MADVLDQGAKKRAQENAALQEKKLAEQTRKENLKTLESESDVARRKATAKSGGARGSLLATSETGLSKTLG